MLEATFAMDVCQELPQSFAVAHELRHLHALHLSEDNICKTLSGGLAHDNQVMCPLSCRSSATKYLQRKSEIPIVNQIWVVSGQVQETLGLRGNRWMVSLTADKLQDQRLCGIAKNPHSLV